MHAHFNRKLAASCRTVTKLVMEEYTTEQRVEIIQAYYENGQSKKKAIS